MIFIDPQRSEIENLPIVGDAAATHWRDRADASRYWYAPVFEPVRPDPASDPSSGNPPFLFAYFRTGATPSGRPAITAQVRFTLRPRMSPATETALTAAGVTAAPVPTENLAVSMQIPFVAGDGKTKVQIFPASLIPRHDGTYEATVEILNDWARLCYGSLARAGFQNQPARVSVAFTFPAYVPVHPTELVAVLGGKAALTPIVRSPAGAASLGGRPHFDATTFTVRHAAGKIRLIREAARAPWIVAAGPAETTARAVAAGEPRDTLGPVTAVSARFAAVALRPEICRLMRSLSS